jgi:hypothetical protein
MNFPKNQDFSTRRIRKSKPKTFCNVYSNNIIKQHINEVLYTDADLAKKHVNLSIMQCISLNNGSANLFLLLGNIDEKGYRWEKVLSSSFWPSFFPPF